MNNKYKSNYIKCPDCSNILDLSYMAKKCPNPLCGFNFKGLEAYLDQNDDKLYRELRGLNPSDRKYKLIITAIKFNMYDYLIHFIDCNSGAHYNTLFKYFIKDNLEDINILKKVLSSEYIKNEKKNTIKSKNGYKIYSSLFKYLIKVKDKDTRIFLKKEFPQLS